VLAGTSAATMGAAAVAGGAVAQVNLGGANASLVNNTGHGLAVSSTQTVLSGGTTSTSLTLNNGGATFANTLSGAPTRVTGVASGTQDFDAINYRQYKELAGGVATSVAMLNIPQVDESKGASLGVGIGYFQGQTALAVGGSYRVAPETVIKASVGANASARNWTAGVGVGMSW